MRTHTKEKPYQCTECGRKFAQKDNMKKHLQTHTKEKPYKCIECDKRFTQKDNMKKHVLRHAGIKSNKCNFCQYSCTDRADLKKHVERVHGSKSFTCEQCEKSFKAQIYLKKHMLCHSDTKAYECDQCKSKFKSITYLKYHMNVHNKTKNETCRQCKKSVTNLKVHFRTHTGEKPYICSYCQRAFSLALTLKNHTYLHTGETPLKCNQCDWACIQKKNMKSHKFNTHSRKSNKILVDQDKQWAGPGARQIFDVFDNILSQITYMWFGHFQNILPPPDQNTYERSKYQLIFSYQSRNTNKQKLAIRPYQTTSKIIKIPIDPIEIPISWYYDHCYVDRSYSDSDPWWWWIQNVLWNPCGKPNQISTSFWFFFDILSQGNLLKMVMSRNFRILTPWSSWQRRRVISEA